MRRKVLLSDTFENFYKFNCLKAQKSAKSIPSCVEDLYGAILRDRFDLLKAK